MTGNPLIEMILRNFGLSLLAPQRHYSMVSRYIDQTRLADGRGRGQRLVYLKVGERPVLATGGATTDHSFRFAHSQVGAQDGHRFCHG